MATQAGDTAPESNSQVTRVDIFVMSPNDVRAEREIVDDVVTSLNRVLAENLGMALLTRKWENLTGDVGRTAQDLTNRAYLDKPLWIYVGIMSRTIGSPTGGADQSGRPYRSGTLEEFQRVLTFKRASTSDWPRILFYRDIGGHAPTKPDEIRQLLEVAEFFEQFKGGGEHPGRFFEFRTPEELRIRLNEDLQAVLLDLVKELDRAGAGGGPPGWPI